ncbi:DUF262 domain-containing protein [Clostridium sp. CF011]|uniref:DUF262 domain-containing protein n=1 Tax=Clostridium sp. CF011 TaxID=2843318 RepID=UPI001C0B05B4|nr:DUF262 domain-containing protein [Clostridium sp. CF011]MBU3093426.1 DUF262 domain-containing protein [Clostridium sp. CF011]WAG71271.1 DUF262 domain-containing protein [Clostridium sp. CF011]
MELIELFKLVEEKKLVLPDFQRDLVWNKGQQKELIASLILSLPIGSFLILDGKNDDFATKELGFPNGESNPKEECMYLLDGQQRLTSLKGVLSDFFSKSDWKDTAREVYKILKVRWFLRITPKQDEIDIFGWKDLKFNPKSLIKEEPSNIENRLVFENIGVTLSKKWYNPDFEALDISGNKIEKHNSILNAKAKDATKEGWIPLYSLFRLNDEKAFYEYVIDKIANERKDELINDYKDDTNKIIEILGDVEPDIEIFIENNNETAILDTWSKLAAIWKVQVQTFLENILKQKVDIIRLQSDEICRAVVIFERINKGGTPLDNFDLVVARAARDKNCESLSKRITNLLESDYDISHALTSLVKGNKPQNIKSSNMETIKEKEINTIIKKQYLNLLSILSYTRYGDIDDIKIDLMKREKILNIKHEDINGRTNTVINGIIRACSFLQMRCGIVKITDLHYTLMLLPIAYLLLDDNVWNSNEKLAKLEFWYWASIIGGEYINNQNEKCIKDTQNLYKWIVKGENGNYEKLKDKMLNVEGFCDMQILLGDDDNETVTNVVHKTILQYILSGQPKDLLYDISLNPWEIARGKEILIGNETIKIEVQDHHIIPLKNCVKIGESSKQLRDKKNHILNSPLNRTYILSKTNNKISDLNPIKYLEDIFEKNNNNSVFVNHFISSEYKQMFEGCQQNESDCYKKILEKRFIMLKDGMVKELDDLLSIRD